MKSRPLLERLDEMRALAVDIASFGFVNLLQSRHPLPPDFRQTWDDFAAEWSTRPSRITIAFPKASSLRNCPIRAGSNFPVPIPAITPPITSPPSISFPASKAGTAPTMLLAHGLMSVSDFGYRLWARRLNALGWNAVFIHLPYHYSRRLPRHFHGELCISGDLLRNAAGIRQSVVECRIVLQQLYKKGGRLFGGWGTSYGGWMMGLLGCFEPLLQRLVLVEPILQIDNAIWKSPSSVALRAALRKVGLTPDDTARCMRLVCPGKLKPLLDPHHVIMLAGLYDRIAPPEEIDELARFWGGAHFAAYPQGHVGYTLMPESFRLAQKIWASDFTLESSSDPEPEVKSGAMDPA